MPRKERLQSVYEGFHPFAAKVPWYFVVWSSYHIPGSFSIVWIACNDRLPTKDHVSQYNAHIDTRCCLSIETTGHLFFVRPFAREVVGQIMYGMEVNSDDFSFQQWIRIFSGVRHKEACAAVAFCFPVQLHIYDLGSEK